MKLPCLVIAGFVTLAFAVPFQAQETKAPQKDDGFVSMWNGKDLTGWVNVNCAPGTFFVKDDMIITTGKPTGYLRTAKQYENFIAEFDWMHIPPKPGAVGNSGFFVWADALPAIGTGYTRGIEVQVLVNLEYKDKKTGAITATSHGDLFSIWGATCVPERPHPLGWERCLPSENRAKGENEWNHYRVEANDGVIKLHVNGKMVSSVSKCSPRKGYLALEAEGSECRFKNLKIKELPSTNPKKEEIATEDQGHRSLFDGLTFDGWKTDEKGKKSWTARDGVMVFKKGDNPLESALITANEYGALELILDYRLPKQKDDKNMPAANIVLGDRLVVMASPKGLTLVGGNKVRAPQEQDKLKAEDWNRLQITIQGGRFTVVANGRMIDDREDKNLAAKAPIRLNCADGGQFRSLFLRELK
jgi:hypothetical protein